MVVAGFDSQRQNMNVNSYRYGSQVILMKGLDLLASGAIPDTFLWISHGKNAVGYFLIGEKQMDLNKKTMIDNCKKDKRNIENDWRRVNRDMWRLFKNDVWIYT